MPRRSPEGLREVIRDYRRDQIIDVARRLFGERGTTEVSMDEIALAAGVARSTLYVYFPSREQLLGACLQRMYQLAQAAIVASCGEGAGPPERLAAVVRGLLERIDEDPVFFRLTVAATGSAGTAGEPVDAELLFIGLDVSRLLVDLVADGVRSGRFAPVDPARAAALIGQQLWGALAVRAGDPTSVPLDQVVEEITTFVLRGLAA